MMFNKRRPTLLLCVYHFKLAIKGLLILFDILKTEMVSHTINASTCYLLKITSYMRNSSSYILKMYILKIAHVICHVIY